MTRDLTDRVVAVTGAARGIGLATARACKAAGMRVAIGDLDGDLAAKVAAEHELDLGAHVDVTDRDVFADFLNGVEEQLGPLYALVNNAGVFSAGHYEQEPDDVTERLIAANVGGVATGSKLALQRLLPRRDGHIVNVSSIAAVMPTGGTATYCMTKSAVLGLTRSLRAELRGTGVLTTAILPGFIDTEMTASFRPKKGLSPPPAPPSAVGEAVVAALRTGRREAFVPRTFTPLGWLLAALGPGAGDWLARATGLQDIPFTLDPGKASAYAARLEREYRR